MERNAEAWFMNAVKLRRRNEKVDKTGKTVKRCIKKHKANDVACKPQRTLADNIL